MRKYLKNSLLEIFDTIFEAHNSVRELVKNSEYEKAVSVLGDCQDAAVQIGGFIEESEGEDCPVISLLLKYCEELYHVSESLTEVTSVKQMKKGLDKALFAAQKSFEENVKVKLEVVFLPYKASMWDSLESIWKAADADPDCDAYVVPIPYYDRNPDHSFGEFHYEGNEYPDYVPVTHYNSYDIATRKPDVIYIHNPYDDCNYVTSVDPRFYSRELKKYTDKLVYVPYFVLAEPLNPEDIKTLEGIAHFMLTPGVINADEVIVQSENMKKAYTTVLLNQFGDTEDNRELLEKKISGKGSPKFDKVVNTSVDDYTIPDEWKKIIYRADGTRKKIVFYNNSIGALLENDAKMIEKMHSVLNTFFQYREDIALLWRPHPLIKATIESMRPHLREDYSCLVEKYRKDNWGIYDDSADLNRAIAISDAYYGDSSSVVQLCKEKKMPIMIQNIM